MHQGKVRRNARHEHCSAAVQARELLKALDNLGVPQPEQMASRFESGSDLTPAYRWVPSVPHVGRMDRWSGIESSRVVLAWFVVGIGGHQLQSLSQTDATVSTTDCARLRICTSVANAARVSFSR